ncbi:MAG TPA: ABC transporter permease [Vicinamibacterales bacterium]|nr:ABC transporter permease [Vicinamibacterales bacterium]
MSDLRFVFRVLTRAPGFTITVLLALAVGIGATTAIFSLVNGVLLRPLPYAASDRLVMVWQDYTARGGPIDEWGSPGNVRDWRNQHEVFSSVSAISGWNPAWSSDGPPEALRGEQVTHEYFTTLGLEPALGRWFEPREDIPGAPRAVVISHAFWQARFGGDGGVIGQSLRLGDEPHEIVGVAPPAARGAVVEDAVLWRPIRLNLATPTYGSIFLRVLARLAPGVTFEAAQSRMPGIASALQAQSPELRQATIYLQRAQEWIVGDARLPLIVLMAAVLTLLALTIANIANLLLARASARERELSIRAAIGASRGRLVRLMILESLALSLAGGALGVVAASWILNGLMALAGDFLPRAADVHLDGRVLAFTAAIATVTGVLFGLAPAAQASRPDLQAPLRDGARTTSRRGHAARSVLVVAQIALALVMLVSAGLIVRSFAGMRQADLGYEGRGVATGTISLPAARYRGQPEIVAKLKQLEERLPSLPGATHVGFTSVLPVAPGGDSDMGFGIVGKPDLQEDGRSRVSWYRSVSASYFQTVGMRMARGRGIAPGAAEAVINESFGRRFFPGEDPLGRQLMIDDAPLNVVGIVADARTRGPRTAARNEMFLPYEAMPQRTYAIVARTEGDAASLIPSMRALVAALDPTLPLAGPATLESLQADVLAQPRLLAVLLAAFAGAALLLALLGVYAVIAFAAGERTTEMGVRLALGAAPRQVVGLVLRDGLKLAAVGLVLGTAASFAASAKIGALLYGVSPYDPMTLGVAAATIAVTAAFGSWIPARRAAKIAPTEALRS